MLQMGGKRLYGRPQPMNLLNGITDTAMTVIQTMMLQSPKTAPVGPKTGALSVEIGKMVVAVALLDSVGADLDTLVSP